LYECLTGATPYPGDTVERQINGHLTADPPKPSRVGDDVPSGFDDVIATGLAKDPDQRYQGARELADAARHALTSTTTPHDPDTADTVLDVAQAAPVTVVDDQLAALVEPATERMWQQSAAEPTIARSLAASGPGPPDQHPFQSAGPPHRAVPQPRRRLMWALIAAIPVAGLAAVFAVTGGSSEQQRPSGTQTSAPPTPEQPTGTSAPVIPERPSSTSAPVTPAALNHLLLNPDQINAATGATAMSIAATTTVMADDTANVPDQACLPMFSPTQAAVYAGSGWKAVGGLQLSDHHSHAVGQTMVLFGSRNEAAAFFAASAQGWPACSNRSYSVTRVGKPDQVYAVGPVTNTNGTLSAAEHTSSGLSCQRALTVANDVVIDVDACGPSPSDAAVTIAGQIAAKVPTS
jgi:serine/threonine-protein kinase